MTVPLCQVSKHVSVASPVMCFVGEENDIIDFYFRQKIIGTVNHAYIKKNVLFEIRMVRLHDDL